MRLMIKVCGLGILTSAGVLLLRLHFGLDGDLGVFIILASLPTTFLVRHLPPEYHLVTWGLGQAIVWSGVWFLALSRKAKRHGTPKI
jgi:hypothetical protein